MTDDFEVIIPRPVRKEASSMLGIRGLKGRRRTERCDMIEVFSPPRIAPLAAEHGLVPAKTSSYDLTSGWDCYVQKDRDLLYRCLNKEKPYFVMMSPECRMFSQMQNLGKRFRDWTTWLPRLDRAIQQFHFCLEVALFQVSHGRAFAIEHPLGASSWQLSATKYLESLPHVVSVRIDMCYFGLQVDPGGPSEKSTRIMTNSPGLLNRLRGCVCPGGARACSSGGIQQVRQPYGAGPEVPERVLHRGDRGPPRGR